MSGVAQYRVAVLASAAQERWSPRVGTGLVVLVVAHVAVVVAASFAVSSYRGRSPDWTAQVTAASAACRDRYPRERVVITYDQLGIARITVRCEDLTGR